MRPSHPVSLELGFLSYTPVISNIGLVTQPQVLLLSMVLKQHGEHPGGRWKRHAASMVLGTS